MPVTSGVPTTAAPGVQPGTPSTNVPGRQGMIPWRKATLMKRDTGAQDVIAAYPATQQALGNRTLEGSGFIKRVSLDAVVTTVGNAAAVAYQPDAPWSVFQSVVFKAVGTDLINISGYGLYLANLYGGFGFVDPATSLDTSIYNLVAGAGGGVGGSFRTRLEIPLAINDRSEIGLLGNQDRSTKYELNLDLAPSGNIYTVLPTAAGAFRLSRRLHFATVPAATDVNRVPQQQVPGHYTTLHRITEAQNETNPSSGSTVVHWLHDLGNTIRYIVLVFRDSTGARSNAMLPTRIAFKVGSDTVFNESAADLRSEMRKQYGFDAPVGVVCYSWMQDMNARAGFELGDDYVDTRNVSNASIECQYPVFAATPGTLQVITDTLAIPTGLDIYSYV